jgi:signal transduction histidine kinase/CheY-like chemotaxis protein
MKMSMHGQPQQNMAPRASGVARRWTLASKIILSLGALLIGLAIGVAALTFMQVRQTAFTQLEGKGIALADALNYTFEVLLGQDSIPSLQRVTENSATIPDVRKILIVRRDRQILASNDHIDVGKQIDTPLLRAYLDRANWQRSTQLTDNGELIIIQPLRGGQFGGGVDGDVVGAVQVTLDRGGAESAARMAALQLLGISLGSYLLLSLLLTVVLRLLVVRPLNQLSNVAERFRMGDRTFRSRIRRGDEIGLLSATFDDMADEVGSMLNNLEVQVATRTADLERATAEAQTARATAEQANDLKTQFLANMSHELRTPLNSIINFTRILSVGMRGPINEAQLDYLNRVHQSGEHLLGLINDILDLSKIEAGRMELVKEPLQIPELVQGVMATAAGLVRGKSIELRQDIAPDLPIIEADRTRIRQVLLNLLSNAAKFTDSGTITVRAALEGDKLVLSVQDSGIGIAPEHLTAVFEEFRQIEGDVNRRYEGTGLGLTICRRLVELHGGQIWVESTLGVGSTFSFSLPATRAPAREAPAVVVATPPQAGACVLVIDDDAAAIEIVAAYLSHDGYAVYGVTDSRRALEEAHRLQPAAIILDVLMPHKDGWEVLAELKTDPDLQATPVALYTIVEEQKLGFYLGASAYLTKPIDEEQLRTTVARLATSGATIMVIDDDPNAREIVSYQLEQAGIYTVVAASGGQEGLDRISAHPPDLIILDLMMPEVDGFAVLDALGHDSRTHAIPVIVLTAKELTGLERDTLNQRVSSLLMKGMMTPEQLLGKVTDLLGGATIPRTWEEK